MIYSPFMLLHYINYEFMLYSESSS